MITRSLRILSRPFVRNVIQGKNLQPKRNYEQVNKWVYREVCTDAPRIEYLAADGLNAFMWWWIFVHLWYQPGHVFGEYDFPEPEKWSDAQLGVVDVD